VSNTPKAKGKPFSLDRYRAEAVGSPFELWLDDTTSIKVDRPTADQMFEAESAMREGTSRDVLAALCGDKADELLKAVGPEDAAVLRAVVEDIQEHFGLGN
jgi:hypothetical protein